VSSEIPSESTAPRRAPISALDHITAIVLWAVILSLAWMVSVAYQPDYFRYFSVELEIVSIIGLLMGALVLVSIVALRHTRSPMGEMQDREDA
jgi:hypothetical protein